jgi:Uma2 family endonuclease
MTSQPKDLLTPDEYLAIERKAELKSEYYAGEVFAMAGASREHNLIVSSIIRMLGNQLLERNCNVYPSDMRVKIVNTGKYTYPDVAVVCGTERFEDEHRDTLLNPAVIIEVLSDTTEAYDRGKKFENYQYIDSLREYILVAQEPYRIERYIRQNDKTWTYTEFHEAEEKVELSTIGCELSLQDVYAKVVSLSQDRV